MKSWKWVTVLLFPPAFPLPFLLNLFSTIRATRDLLPRSWHRCLPPPVWSLRATQLLSCLLPLPPPPTQAPRLSHHLGCAEASSQLPPSLCFLTLLLSTPSPESPWPYGIRFCAWTSPSQAICKTENKAVFFSGLVFLYTQHRRS